MIAPDPTWGATTTTTTCYASMDLLNAFHHFEGAATTAEEEMVMAAAAVFLTEALRQLTDYFGHEKVFTTSNASMKLQVYCMYHVHVSFFSGPRCVLVRGRVLRLFRPPPPATRDAGQHAQRGHAQPGEARELNG